MNRFESRPVDVRVNLRRGNIGVAEHGLDRAQIGASFEQVGGKGMAQRMRLHFFVDARQQGVTTNELPETLAGHRFSRTIRENKRARFSFEQFRSNHGHILRQLFARPLAERHSSYLGALAFYGDLIPLEADSLGLQLHQLRHAQAGRIKQL